MSDLYTRILTGQMGQGGQNDRRSAMAQRLMEGAVSTPAYTSGAGIAQALSAALGGWMSGSAQRAARTEREGLMNQLMKREDNQAREAAAFNPFTAPDAPAAPPAAVPMTPAAPPAPAMQDERPAGPLTGPRAGITPAVAPAELMPHIEAASRETGIPVPLLVAQLRQESNFNPNAVGRSGEIGVAQIMPSTARQPGFGVPPADPETLRDPAANIRFGAQYLAARGRAAGVTDWNDPSQVAKALAAYNGGGDPNYVQNVTRWMPPGGAQPAQPGPVPAVAPGGAPPQAQPAGGRSRYNREAIFAGLRHENPLVREQARVAARLMEAEERQNQPTEMDRMLASAGLEPGSPQAQAVVRAILERRGQAPQTNVTVGGGPQIGTVPPGYQAIPIPGGGFRMEVVPGGPADRTVARENRTEANRQAQTQRQGGLVVQEVDRVLGLMDNSTLPVTGGVGSVLSRIPGTAARDVSALLDTIRAEGAFGRLQQMREASPTGGALGAVTENELRLLQASLGSLEQSQSSDQFRDNLNRVRNIYLDIIHGPGQGPERARLSFEREGAAGNTDSAPRVIEYDAQGRRVTR